VRAARNVAVQPGPDESTERVTSLVVGEEVLVVEQRGGWTRRYGAAVRHVGFVTERGGIVHASDGVAQVVEELLSDERRATLLDAGRLQA
jgi:hypothetical protein